MKIDSINWNKVLNNSLKSFNQSELCYLALTSKPEATIRNKVAWNLQLHSKSHLIARECSVGDFHRVDMAVFHMDEENEHFPIGIEFKTANVANMLHYSFKSSHLEDFNKDLNKRDGKDSLITVFYEALNPIDDKYSKVIKNHKRHNKIEDHSITNNRLQKILEEEFSKKTVQWITPFTAHDFLGIGVRFHCFIINKN